MASDVCKILKGDILLHVRVTHEDVQKKNQKNVENDEKDQSFGIFYGQDAVSKGCQEQDFPLLPLQT